MFYCKLQKEFKEYYHTIISDIAVYPQNNYTIQITADDGRIGTFDVNPYFEYETFNDFKNKKAFKQVSNGGYLTDCECGADLSADTIEAHWKFSKPKA